MDIMKTCYPKINVIPKVGKKPVSSNFATTARRTPHKECLKRIREQGIIFSNENGELLTSLSCSVPSVLAHPAWQCMHMQ